LRPNGLKIRSPRAFSLARACVEPAAERIENPFYNSNEGTMPRSRPLPWGLFVLGLSLLIGTGEPCQGQQRVPDQAPPVADPFEAKHLAKAQYEAEQRKPRALAVEKQRTAEEMYRGRFREFLAGRGVRDLLLDAGHQLLDAETSLAETPAERAAALERQWERAYLCDDIDTAKYYAGRLSVADHMTSRAARLEAEIAWSQARGGQETYATPAPPMLEMDSGPARPWSEEDKAFAKAKFAASRADPTERLEAARETARARMQEYRAGRAYLESSAELLKAQLAVARSQSERAAAFESCWKSMRVTEYIDEAKYQAERVSIADYLSSRYMRLEAEIWLVRERAKQKRVVGREARTAPFITTEDADWGHEEIERVTKDFFATTRADADQLARDKLATAEGVVRGRYQEFLAGRGTLDSLCKWSRRLADSELAVHDKPDERAADLRSYWRLARAVEDVIAREYEGGRRSPMDYAQARLLRLDAEIRWAEARGK